MCLVSSLLEAVCISTHRLISIKYYVLSNTFFFASNDGSRNKKKGPITNVHTCSLHTYIQPMFDADQNITLVYDLFIFTSIIRRILEFQGLNMMCTCSRYCCFAIYTHFCRIAINVRFRGVCVCVCVGLAFTPH